MSFEVSRSLIENSESRSRQRPLQLPSGCPFMRQIILRRIPDSFHFTKPSGRYLMSPALAPVHGNVPPNLLGESNDEEAPDEARKQQFGATALIMGLIPLTLKDVAWPERRIALVSAPLPFAAAVLVRALGLEPAVEGELESDQVQRYMQWMQGYLFANVGTRWRISTILRVGTSFLILLLSYGMLAVVEIYSKRSSLGCVYPVFTLTWCIVGIFPAIIHALFAIRRRRCKGGSDLVSTGSVSAIQGAEEAWPVQLAWGVYYIAGTLVFTSIMAVTVAELAVWVFVQAVVTAASKIFALYICLLLRNPDSDAYPIDGN
ncbi:hypothetical protein ACO22_00867 [Paracoccidioides brasiliensis]|uniref:Uncharacterized protein n=1 Tax=Paracoccidioides brasiliensis TaxID=121759 RepID=A0A1D2JN21_PARBR|nr:hypothetical protein ACO22_00867 [Paracoccidioides brasiliensis]